MNCTICRGSGTVQSRLKPSKCPRDVSSCAPCTKLAYLDQQLEETEGLLARLSQERQDLLHMVNQVHDPFILRLPLEVAFHIFQLCMPDGDDSDEDPEDEVVLEDGELLDEHDPNRYEDDEDATTQVKVVQAPEILGMVCHQWRRIACSNHRLWSSIPISLRKRNLNTQLDVLERWVEWSGDLPLRIAVWTLSNFDYWETRGNVLNHRELQAWKPSLDLVNRLAPRWQCLRIVLPGFALPHIVGNGEFPSRLEELRIECVDHSPLDGLHATESFSLTGLAEPPRLRRLELEAIPMDNVKVIWSGVTEIRLINYYIEECLEFLHNMPRLRRLTIWRTLDGDCPNIEPENRLTHVRHTSLRALTVQDLGKMRDGRCLFDFLTLPSLTEMDATCFQWIPSLVSMISRSKCAIQYLVTLDSPNGADDWIDLFHAVPSCTELALLGTSLTDTNLFLLTTRHSTSTPPSDSGEPTLLLPNLTDLRWTVNTSIWQRGERLDPQSRAEAIGFLHSVYIPTFIDFFVPHNLPARPLRYLHISVEKHWSDESGKPVLDTKTREHISRSIVAGIHVLIDDGTGQSLLD